MSAVSRCRHHGRRHRRGRCQTDGSLWRSAWIPEGICGNVSGIVPAVSLARGMQDSRKDQGKGYRNRERAGISACPFSLGRNAYQHCNYGIARKVTEKALSGIKNEKSEETGMKKKVLAVGIMALVTGIIVAVRRKKKYAKAV